MEDITDAAYNAKIFELKNLQENHNLYVQSDTLLLDDVFENFQNICFEIYELDPTNFFQPVN